MLFLKNGFVVPKGIDLFFDDRFKYFGVAQTDQNMYLSRV
jgi:hypothetical protein